MESQLVYFLRAGDKEKFLATLKKDNRRYHLGYRIIHDEGDNIDIESYDGHRIGCISSTIAPPQLTVNRNVKGRYASLDNQVENLMTIADAYPKEVSWEQLKGVSNPTIVDRHMAP